MVCALANAKPKPSPVLHPIIAEYFNQYIQIDFKGYFGITEEGYNSVLSIIDIFTGYTRCIPTKGKSNTDAINALLINWISIFGKPYSIQNDGGDGFKHQNYNKFLENMDINQTKGNPYKATTQGRIERVHKELNKCLRTYSVQNKESYIGKNGFVDDWSIVVSLFNIKMNNKLLGTSGYCSNELVFGIKPNDTLDTLLKFNDINNELNMLKENDKGYNGYLNILNGIRYFKNVKWTEYLNLKWIKEKLKWNKNYKYKPFKIDIGSHVMINTLSRYQGFSNQAKIGINNMPFYIVTKILPFNRVNIRNIINGKFIYEIDITRLIPYIPNDIINNELSNIDISLGFNVNNCNNEIIYKNITEESEFEKLDMIMCDEVKESIGDEIVNDTIDLKTVKEKQTPTVRTNKRYELRNRKRVNYSKFFN